MDRRNFLRRTGALTLPFAAGLPGVRAAGSSLLSSLLTENNGKVLVLVQLVGGNDGLNTLIGLDQYDNLRQVRQNVVLPLSSLINITTEQAFHPRMTGMQRMFSDGQLSVVQSVGYPNQNRSHFRSTDIWTTGTDAETVGQTGWLARHLETDHPDYPNGYPNDPTPDPLAVTMGNVANETCQGTVTNLSQTVNNPFNVTDLLPGGNTPVPDDNYGSELSFLRLTMEQANAYGSRIVSAANAGDSQVNYPDHYFARHLQNVARLISGGLQTQVYVVTLGGFDTHANQVAGGSANGQHADLLGTLSDSLRAFQQDLAALNVDDRVLGMTFSEFGRRIRSNASRGTDHGTAAPLFIFGNCAAAGTILGSSPEIDTAVDQNTGVPMQYDFRDVYGSILMDWFDVPESDVRSLLYPSFVYLPVAGGCRATLPVELLNFTAAGRERHIDVNWQTGTEVNNQGFEVERSTNGRDFEYAGYVAATPESRESVRNYAFADTAVVRGTVYYYRLRQIDLDGSAEFSSIVTARLAGSRLAEWKFGHPVPNPVKTETTIQVYAPTDGTVRYVLFDLSGRRMLTDSATVIGNRDNRFTVRVGRIPTGTYTLRMEAENTVESRQLVVQ